jgi:acid phosphatase (class A)
MRIKLLILSLFFLPLQVQANPYFAGDSISSKAIDKPSDIDSEERMDEIKQIIELQRNADKGEIKKATEERGVDLTNMIQKIDKKYTRKKYPHLYKLLDNAVDTSIVVAENSKICWKIKRPYLISDKVKLLSRVKGDYSYPSGNTVINYVSADILITLIPDKKKQISKLAEDMSNRKVLLGTFYPSDITAGKKLAGLVLRKLKENESFQKDFSEAEKEVR